MIENIYRLIIYFHGKSQPISIKCCDFEYAFAGTMIEADCADDNMFKIPLANVDYVKVERISG